MTDLTTPALAGDDAQLQADATTEATAENLQAETVEQTEQTEEAKKEAWPKKAENALAKEKGKAARLKWERDQARAEITRLQQQSVPRQPQPKNDGLPQEADYKNYADYMEAVNEYKIEKRFAERDGKQLETQRTYQEQAWVSQREQAVAVQAQTFAKETPEIAQLLEDYGDVIDDYSPALQKLFLEADNAPLAFYNLAKEGRLEGLAGMSLARAAMEIGRAQTQAIPPKPKTKAPTPMSPAKGSASGSKDPSLMTDSEFNKWRRSQIKSRSY